MGPEDERESEDAIEPGDLVIKLVHGTPMVQTRPGGEEDEEE